MENMENVTYAMEPVSEAVAQAVSDLFERDSRRYSRPLLQEQEVMLL